MNKVKKHDEFGRSVSGDGEAMLNDGHVEQRISCLESKLEDTIELLHLWKNEALAYRKLVEALVVGEVTHETARRALTLADPAKIEELGF